MKNYKATTVDESIREKAIAKFRRALEDWKQETFHTLGLQPDAAVVDININSHLFQILDAICKAALAANADRVGQHAVDDFISNIEIWSNQLPQRTP